MRLTRRWGALKQQQEALDTSHLGNGKGKLTFLYWLLQQLIFKANVTQKRSYIRATLSIPRFFTFFLKIYLTEMNFTSSSFTCARALNLWVTHFIFHNKIPVESSHVEQQEEHQQLAVNFPQNSSLLTWGNLHNRWIHNWPYRKNSWVHNIYLFEVSKPVFLARPRSQNFLE